MDELISYAGKLTVKDANGKITRMGFLPPNWFGPFYSVMCYWKPEFINMIDMANKKVVADQPGIIESFAVLQKLWNIYGDPAIVDEYMATLGNGLSPDDPFLTGKVSMLFDGDWRNGYESRYTDNKFNVDYGMVPIPAPAGMENNYGASYFFGMNFLMPYNAPHPEEAWEAVKFLTSYPIDVKIIEEMWNNPVNKKALDDPSLRAMPGMEVQLDSLKTNQGKMCYLPVTPVTGQLSAAIQQQVDLLVHNKLTPEEAAKAINEAVQPELDALK
jgi:multiple sugar transport system substrate-binding protein